PVPYTTLFRSCDGQLLDDLGRHHADVGRRLHRRHPISSLSSSGAGGLSCTVSRLENHSSSFQISNRLGAPTTMTLPSRRANLRRVGGRPMRPVESSLALAAPE